MDWKSIARWTAVISGTISGTLGAVAAVVASVNTLSDQPWMPASHSYVNDLVEKFTAVISTKLDDISNDVARNRIETLRTTLAQMQGERAQLDDLRAKNPDSELLRLKLAAMDEDISQYDAMLRGVTCQFNKKLTPGFICP